MLKANKKTKKSEINTALNNWNSLEGVGLSSSDTALKYLNQCKSLIHRTKSMLKELDNEDQLYYKSIIYFLNSKGVCIAEKYGFTELCDLFRHEQGESEKEYALEIEEHKTKIKSLFKDNKNYDSQYKDDEFTSLSSNVYKYMFRGVAAFTAVIAVWYVWKVKK